METKICSKCEIEKDINCFGIRKENRDGHHGFCKECSKLYFKIYSINNKDKIKKRVLIWVNNNRDKARINQKRYREKNKERLKEVDREYHRKNKEYYNKMFKQYYEKNADKLKKGVIKWQKENSERLNIRRNKRHKERYENDILYKIKCNVRNRLKLFLRTKNIRNHNKTLDIVGCSPHELKNHIEKQFTNGMSWENYGKYGWHIDHVIPLNNAKTIDEIYKLSNYMNLQPLWCHENYKKRF